MPNEPISAAPQPATVPAQSLRSAQAPSTWPTNAEILAALGPWMLQRRWFPLKGDAAPPLGSLRVIASWEPEEGVRDLVIAALRGNQAETGHRDGMVLLRCGGDRLVGHQTSSVGWLSWSPWGASSGSVRSTDSQ